MNEKENMKYVRVNVEFLEGLVNYLKTKPFEEVQYFITEIIKGVNHLEENEENEK